MLHVDGLRFTDTLGGAAERRRSHRNGRLRSGRSTIEIHVQRSDITWRRRPAFTRLLWGRPGKDVIDLAASTRIRRHLSRSRRVPARRLHEHRAERIFGNSRRSKTYTPLGEIALQGPGAMMAQGNYFGDIAPADGKGDALGECHVMPWPETPKRTSAGPPHPQRALRTVHRSRPGAPTGIDARFHLATDPRPPKK